MLIYKICDAGLWRDAVAAGQFDGAGIDLADGYIHFSTAAQMHETAAKHFSGRVDLMLVAADADGLGEALKWEPSRGGNLFPHLYRAMQVGEAVWATPLPLGPDGTHMFPEAAE